MVTNYFRMELINAVYLPHFDVTIHVTSNMLLFGYISNKEFWQL